jgi:hypothetical protein
MCRLSNCGVTSVSCYLKTHLNPDSRLLNPVLSFSS